ELVGINAVAGDAGGGAEQLRVASRPAANVLLAGALDTVGAQLDRQQAAIGPLGLLTESDGERFASALAVLRDGVALARSVSPELVDDVLAHVALVGILDPQHGGRLASASSRWFPGLVLLESPQSSIEVAEALVHEGAHQKLFDLAITHDLLDADSDRCPTFHPPWAPEGRFWPLEQTLAAGHAYACLACFAHDSGVTVGRREVPDGSLLPVASERCEIIGRWLLDRGDHLGPDAHALLEGLLGRRPRTARTTSDSPTGTAVDYVVDPGLEFRRGCSPDRVLVGRPSRPPQLYWVSEDAAALLELLGHKPLDDAVDTFAQRWCVSQFDAGERLAALLSELSASGLVTSKLRAALSS
ncbi:MAG: aKG-HExxH-type peptide beta-hydroxylase, partial [Pseudonocardiaceae bacterium]